MGVHICIVLHGGGATAWRINWLLSPSFDDFKLLSFVLCFIDKTMNLVMEKITYQSDTSRNALKKIGLDLFRTLCPHTSKPWQCFTSSFRVFVCGTISVPAHIFVGLVWKSETIPITVINTLTYNYRHVRHCLHIGERKSRCWWEKKLQWVNLMC